MSNSRVRAWSDRALKAEARIQYLEEVLIPFGNLAKVFDPEVTQNSWHDENRIAVPLGMLRKAEAALRSPSEAPEKKE